MDVVIDLLSDDSTIDEYGDEIEEPIEREVFATKLSVRQSEFYQANMNSFKPEIMFKVRAIDYQEEQLVKYDREQGTAIPVVKKLYSVIRAFERRSDEFVELICERVVNKEAE